MTTSARALTTGCLVLMIAGVSTPVLALNKPARATSRYEVLEPETWVGKELPILGNIDIGEQLTTGNWLVVLYHHDCPDCERVLPSYQELARDFKLSRPPLFIALVEVPPYAPASVSQTGECVLGRLSNTKEWLVTTPAVVVLKDGLVQARLEEGIDGLGGLLWGAGSIRGGCESH